MARDASELASLAAGAVARGIGAAVARRGRCALVLAGGSTPRALHGVLAHEGASLPWDRVHVFWGDERYVPHDAPASNYRMARETLLELVPCPAANVHPMRTDFADPHDAARDYESVLRPFVGGAEQRFDVVLLGLGADGHTASLFPRSPALEEDARLVLPATAPAEPSRRLTLTLPALARAAETHFLVAGDDKAEVVRHVLSGKADVSQYPAAAVARRAAMVTWWLDRAAAARLPDIGGATH